MDFNLTAEQSALQLLARNFTAEELLPHAKQWDEQSVFPIAALRKAASLGMAGIHVKEDVQGSNLNRVDAAILYEELAVACVATAAYLSVHNMVATIIDCHGTPDQRQALLPQLVSMQKLASYCLTEPNAGSDAAALQTTAVRKDDYYLVNGNKAFISGGSQSDLYLVLVRTGEPGSQGISCLYLEKDAPGLSFGKPENKLGWKNHPTTSVFFENCKVPVSQRIGKEGEGFKIALQALNGGRINIAACSLGGARACLQASRSYMHERKQFQQKLADFQALQFKFADMATQLEAARLMVYRAASVLDHNHPEAPSYCAMAKRFATDVGFLISDEALQVFGGYGYLHDYPIERYFRDLRVNRILEGTNEIMRLIIARRVLNQDFTFGFSS